MFIESTKAIWLHFICATSFIISQELINKMFYYSLYWDLSLWHCYIVFCATPNLTFSCSVECEHFKQCGTNPSVFFKQTWTVHAMSQCITSINRTCRGVPTRVVWSLDPLMMSPFLESRQFTSWLWPESSIDMPLPLPLLWTRILPSLEQGTNRSYIWEKTYTLDIKNLHTPVKVAGFCHVKKGNQEK